MPDKVTTLIDDSLDVLTSPKWLKRGLAVNLFVAVISQIIVFFVLIPLRLDLPFTIAVRSFFSFENLNFIGVWQNLVGVISFILNRLKIVVYILSFLILAGGMLLIKKIPEERLELFGIVVFSLLAGSFVVLVGIICLELFPFYVMTS